MKKFIKIGYGYKTIVARYFNTTFPSVRRALNFEINNERAKKIREYAIKECNGKICIISEQQ